MSVQLSVDEAQIVAHDSRLADLIGSDDAPRHFLETRLPHWIALVQADFATSESALPWAGTLILDDCYQECPFMVILQTEACKTAEGQLEVWSVQQIDLYGIEQRSAAIRHLICPI